MPLLVASLGVAVVVLCLPRALDADGVGSVRAEESVPVAPATPLVLTQVSLAEEIADDDAQRTPVADASPVIQVKRATALASGPDTPSGRLHVRAVDAATRIALDRIRVRVTSKMRFADRESGRGGFEVGLTLTPGAYALAVLVPGYEPMEVPEVRVAEGERVELATVEMRAGSARILGSVGRSVQPEEELHVEMLGDGRRPCASCAARFDATVSKVDGYTIVALDSPLAPVDRDAPCAQCGYGPQSSCLRVGPAGTFAFLHLASGPYALRLLDGLNRNVGVPVAVQLREAEIQRVDIDAPLLRDVRVEVIDTDGAPLALEWAAIASDGDLSFTVVEGVRDLPWTCAFLTPERRIATKGFSTPTKAAYATSRVGAFGGRKLGSGARRRTVDDRAIREGDLLLPFPRMPEFEIRPIQSRIDADGLVVFEALPDCELTLEMRCSGFGASVMVPASAEVAHVRARLGLAATDDSGVATFRALDAARYR